MKIEDIKKNNEERIKTEKKKQEKTKNQVASFVSYCKENPDQRFWQALRNWSKYPFIFAGREPNPASAEDTFYQD